MAEQLTQQLESISTQLNAINKRLSKIERTGKATAQTTSDINSAVSWNLLFHDLILCGVCLGLSFGVVALDRTKVELCGRVPAPFKASIKGFCQVNAIQPESAPVAQLVALREAIAGQESGHNHRIVNRDSGALGIGQVMPENLPSWSKQAIGRAVTPSEFLQDKNLQLKVIDHKLSEYLETAKGKTSDESEQIKLVACWWYSGPGGNCQSNANQAGYPAIASYAQQVLERYQGIPKGEGLRIGDSVAGYRVTSPYGKRDRPCPGCSAFHKGIDIGTPTGTPILAIGNNARVVCLSREGITGLYAVQESPDFPGMRFESLHLSSCSPGLFNQGEPIASTGTAGTGEHLHFQVRVNGSLIDPPKKFIELALRAK